MDVCKEHEREEGGKGVSREQESLLLVHHNSNADYMKGWWIKYVPAHKTRTALYSTVLKCTAPHNTTRHTLI